jgi:CheY-like chemotaxis protein
VAPHKRILVVDDDRDVQVVLEGALRDYDVVSAYAADEALALAGRDVAFDLVIICEAMRHRDTAGSRTESDRHALSEFRRPV